MRFIDRLRNDGPGLKSFQAGRGKTVLDLLPKATVIVADNVCEYFFAENEKEVWRLEDFPNIAPPFELCFVEMRKPSCINSTEYGHTKWDTGYRPQAWGVLFHATPVPPDLKDIKIPPQLTPKTLMYHASKGIKDVATAGGGWFVSATLVWDAPGVGLEPAWSWGFGVDRQGQAVSSSAIFGADKKFGHLSVPDGHMAEVIDIVADQRLMIQTEFDEKPELLTPEGLASEIMNLLKPALLAISFTHCRNVEQVQNYPPAGLAKKHAKRGRAPLARFYTLKINPMDQDKPRKVGLPAEPTGIEQSLHIVRGHFKTFTESRKLFGRWAGTFWWPKHEAGKRSIGVVEKDYEIISPSNGGSSIV